MKQPKPINVKPIENYMLSVLFENGENKIFDVKPYIMGDWFGKLKNEVYFNTVHISNNHIEWLDGQDIAPHELYEQSLTKVP